VRKAEEIMGRKAVKGFRLVPGEKKAIRAGDTRALRREQKPKVKDGQILVLVWSKGGKQFVERSHRDREKAAEAGAVLTIDIPRKPTLWIELAEPRLKGGEWLVEFRINDHREPTRLLAPPPSPPREPGLKTRWREKVPKRGQQEERFTPETERGYGGGGKSATDEREAVDDAYLHFDRLKREVDLRNAQKQAQQRAKQSAMGVEMKVARRYRHGKAGKRDQEALERAEKRARDAA
jgi:hypothetical protein